MTILLRSTLLLALAGGVTSMAAAAQAGTDCGATLALDAATGPAHAAGTLTGNEICEYTIEAEAGQKMTVQIDSSAPMEAFLIEPIEQVLGDGQPLVLPKSGAYVLRVGMMRAIAANNAGEQSFDLNVTLDAGTAGLAAEAAAATGGRIEGEAVATLDLAGMYEGVLPCASCPGIETTINLYADGSFTRTMVYRDQADGTDQDAGQWWMQEGVLTLHSDDADEQDTHLVVVEDEVLELTEKDGTPVGTEYRLKRTGD